AVPVQHAGAPVGRHSLDAAAAERDRADDRPGQLCEDVEHRLLQRVPEPQPAVVAAGDDVGAVGEEACGGPPPRPPRPRGHCAPVAAFQTRAVPSSLAVTIRVPSGLNATCVTGPECPDMTATGSPSETLKTRAVPSLLADAT